MQIIRQLNETVEIQSDADRRLHDHFAEMKLNGTNPLSDLREIQNMHRDIEENEALLDQHCSEIDKDVEELTQNVCFPPLTQTELMPSKLPRIKIKTSQTSPLIKRTPIDPEKKSKLLAALKSIDSSNDNEN